MTTFTITITNTNSESRLIDRLSADLRAIKLTLPRPHPASVFTLPVPDGDAEYVRDVLDDLRVEGVEWREEIAE